MSRKILVPAQIMGVRALSDKGVALNIHTQEMTDVEKTVLFGFQHKAGWFLFKENEVTPEEIPTEDAEYDQKTPSKRLRSTLYVLWTQLGSQGKFEDYYREKMELFINSVKNKLE